ncbi:aldehyde ferredoxin oxidoreductase [Archaeoglobales archaeon]|nr:MAG: aldehyde ferredoxin oxidoreductase [Archaeoglobales archaeon]
MKGYHGKILKIDLSYGSSTPIDLKEEWAKAYIGGVGLAAKLLFDQITPDLDPFSPENYLAYLTGPFTGTRVPSGSRFAIAGLSPNGVWGESTSGGHFGVALKRAGFDGVLITGKAEKPVYIWVHDGEAEIKDATHLWGKDCYETQEIIKKDLGEKGVRVSCIGLAGENLVKYACVINDAGRAAGRCGFGAVMGSKNLKAVAAHGDAKVEIADEEKFDEAYNTTMRTNQANPFFHLLGKYGTLGYLDMGFLLGDVPYKYFTGTVFPAENVSPTTLMERYPVKGYACFGCPIGCGKRVRYNKKGIDEVDTPEYETIVALGPLCGNLDLDELIYANHLCNAYGMDTISAGVSIAFSMYLFEKGVISERDAGMRLEWGDGERISNLIKMIAKREGFGDVLAEGVRAIAAKFRVNEEEVAEVKGLEVPMHDARAFFGQGLGYATSPRGACHNRPDWFVVELGTGIQELDISPGERFNMQGRVSSFVKYQNFREVYNSLLLCMFIQSTPREVLDLFNSITGWNLSMEEFVRAGERMFNLKRVINNLRGITRKDDKLPRIVTASLNEGPTAGKSLGLEAMLREYYEFRGWDWESGKPTAQKLNELGLGDVAEKIS